MYRLVTKTQLTETAWQLVYYVAPFQWVSDVRFARSFATQAAVRAAASDMRITLDHPAYQIVTAN